MLDVVCIIFTSLFLQCTAGEQYYEMKNQLQDNTLVNKRAVSSSMHPK